MDVLISTEVRKLSRRGAWNRIFANSSVSNGAYRTDVNITGAGYLLYIATSTVFAKMRITIDGNASGTIGNASSYLTTTIGGKYFVIGVPFNTSLKVETYNGDTGPQTIRTEIGYILA